MAFLDICADITYTWLCIGTSYFVMGTHNLTSDVVTVQMIYCEACMAAVAPVEPMQGTDKPTDIRICQ